MMKWMKQVIQELGVLPRRYVENINKMLVGEPVGVMDDGADQSVLGTAFKILSRSGQDKANPGLIPAFSDQLVGMEIGNGVSTVLGYNGEAIGLIQVNQGYIAPDSRESLLATEQIKWNGINVDTSWDGQGGLISMKNGSLRLFFSGTTWFLRLRYTTKKDLATLPRYELTSKKPYKPSSMLIEQLDLMVNPDDWDEQGMVAKPHRGRRMSFWTRDRLDEWGARLGYRSHDIGKKTFQATTQLVPGVDHENSDYPKQHFQVRFPFMRPRFLNEVVYSDTYKWLESGRYRYGQVFFACKSKYAKYYPLKREADAYQAFEDFITDVGAPTRFVTDNAQAEARSNRVRDVLRKYHIQWGTTEAHRQHKNRAERFIQEWKRLCTKMSGRMGSSSGYHQHLHIHACDLWNLTANDSLGKRTPHEALTGDTPDISIIRFRWWQPVWYYEPIEVFPNNVCYPAVF
jgi:hypothetical protein